jgi:hypothetical protein
VRSPDISLIPREPNYIGSAAKPVHTGPWDFLAEVPFVLYGPGYVERVGEVETPATMADVAPTIASLIGFDGFDAPNGKALTEGVRRNAPPRVVLTVVWDGGGWNALQQHPDEWPFLKRLMREGVSYTDFEIGSTPSNTPPIHTTLGTGAFPRVHGIPGVKMETAGGVYIDPFEGNNADLVKVPSLADVYDRARRNRPLIGVVATVNWHLGMIGHGAHLEGADRDIALLLNAAGDAYGDASAYEIPLPMGTSLGAEADALDRLDGESDGLWRGRDLTDPALRNASPAFVSYQAKVLTSLMERERFGADDLPDLLFTNFKSPDDSGHRWGMTSPETGAVVKASDDALRSLVTALDRVVGKRRWVLALTADHGQNIYPEESGGWPIGGGELRSDTNAALDSRDNALDVVTRVTSSGAYVDKQEMRANDLTLVDIARWMADYRAEESVRSGERLPGGWRDRADEPLLDAAVAGSGRAVVTCSREARP